MTKRIRWKHVRNISGVLLATAVVVGAMAWLSGTFRTGRIEPAKLEVEPHLALGRPVVVEKALRPHYADLVGSVQAQVRSAISARVVANIVEVRVHAGDKVNEGDLLVVLDDRDQKARVGQARGALRAAEAKLNRMETELARIEQLAKNDVATPYELTQTRTQHAEAVAEVARAEQMVSEAEVALSDTRVDSPLTGIVIDRQAEPGDQASPGKPLLTVYDPTRLRLEASVREAYIGRLPVGQTVPVVIDATQQRMEGTVEEIVPASDPQSRSFLVKVSIPDPKGLYPGMFGRVRLPLEPHEQIEIPLSAVHEVGQVSVVTAIVNGQLQRRAVRLGQVDGDRVEVLAGLEVGEAVLVRQ